jgi:flagellar hook-associated protein 3 FlgL
MSLRITQSTLYSRALFDIQHGLAHSLQLQEQISTGRRINRPSDDPAAALQIIPLNNDLRTLQQLGSNVSLAQETLNTGAASLEDASAIMQRVRELAMQAANDTVSASDRQSIGSEVDQLLHQMVSIGNSRRGDRFLFGGTENASAPFQLVEDAGGARVAYHGNHDSLQIAVAPGVNTQLNEPGDAIFQAHSRSDTSFTGSTGAQPSNVGDTGIGFQTLSVTFNGLHTDAPSTVTAGNGSTNALGRLSYTFTTTPPTLSVGGGPALAIPATDTTFTTSDGRVITLDVSGVPATLTGTFTSKAGLSTDGGRTLVDVADFSSTQTAVRNGYDNTVLNVDVTALARTGDEHVKYSGTFDSFTTLISLRQLLQNSEQLPDNVVRDRISSMLSEIDSAHNGILDGVRELGFRSSSMDSLQSRVSSLQLSQTSSLSRVQDTDMAQAILEMQRQDMTYQAALQIGARVVQTSLTGFLR